MVKRQVKSHGASGYRAGCRCVTCTLAESDRKRNYRATGNGAKSVSSHDNVSPIRPNITGKPRKSARSAGTAPETAIGDVEAGVIDECAALPATGDRPATVWCARRMAQILDQPELITLHARASRELSNILGSLRGPKKKSRGRLAAVASMTNRKDEVK